MRRRRFVLVSDALTLATEFVFVTLSLPANHQWTLTVGLAVGSLLGSLLTLWLQRRRQVSQTEPLVALAVNRWLGAFALGSFLLGIITLNFHLLLACVLPLVGLIAVSYAYRQWKRNPAA